MHDDTLTLTTALGMITIVLGTALGVGWVFRVLRAPSIVGYLATGILLGPTALGAWAFGGMAMTHAMEFADLGLILLLFTIGLELSPRRLSRMGVRLSLMAAFQLGATALVVLGVLHTTVGMPLTPALILGVGVALSSTAIVLKILSDRGEIHTTIGNVSTGILLLQDVAVIVFLILLPLLSPGDAAVGIGGKFLRLGAGLAALGIVATIAYFLLPRVVRGVTRFGGHEMTVLLAVLLASGGAWAAAAVGWPMAIGACLAGLLLAEADVRHQLIADITPFRDLFNALFFVSLGMLVDLSLIREHAVLLFALVAATLVLKTALTGVAGLLAGWPPRHSFQIALGLCTVSEFAYVLAREANHYGIVNDALLGLLIPFAVGTMLVGAMLVPAAEPIARGVSAFFNARHRYNHGSEASDSNDTLQGHVIIVGYGLGGENLARVLTATRIPHCVVDINRTRIHQARFTGIHAIYGDAARIPILNSAGLAHARALVVGINDAQATRHVVAQARAARRDLYIVARTNYVAELDTLKACGADVVIPAEFEVSIEIFAQVLREFRVPDNIVRAQIASVRAGGYSVLRGVPYDRAAHLKDLLEVFSATNTQTYYVGEESVAANTPLGALGLRSATGASIIAIVRAGSPTVNPLPEAPILPGDVLVLVGSHPQLDAAMALLDAAPPA